MGLFDSTCGPSKPKRTMDYILNWIDTNSLVIAKNTSFINDLIEWRRAVENDLDDYIKDAMTDYDWSKVPQFDTLSRSIAAKADKVVNATNGHLVSLDAQGNLQDGGIAAVNVISKNSKNGVAEGTDTTASGYNSHSEGNLTIASGRCSHAEGNRVITERTVTIRKLTDSEASLILQYTGLSFTHIDTSDEIVDSLLGDIYSDSNYQNKLTSIKYSLFADSTIFPGFTASGDLINVENSQLLTQDTDTATTYYWKVITGAYGDASHIEGQSTSTRYSWGHAEGKETTAVGERAHAEGAGTIANNTDAHAEGQRTYAFGLRSHTEGYYTFAIGDQAHAEGENTLSKGDNSHAEGEFTNATGRGSHAEGYKSTAFGDYSHAGGNGAQANGKYSIAHGDINTKASNDYAVAIGIQNSAQGKCSFVCGESNTAKSSYEFVIGKTATIFTPVPGGPTRLFAIGNGGGSRKNAIAVYSDNTVDGEVVENSAPDPNSKKLITSKAVYEALAGKAASSHTHAIANVTGLQAALDGKVNKMPLIKIGFHNGDWSLNYLSEMCDVISGIIEGTTLVEIELAIDEGGLSDVIYRTVGSFTKTIKEFTDPQDPQRPPYYEAHFVIFISGYTFSGVADCEDDGTIEDSSAFHSSGDLTKSQSNIFE